MPRVDVIHFSDPGCPWAWSASPALAALRWRYGDQLRWRHVMIGLTESGRQYEDRGYTPLMMARGQRRFARWGMPFSREPKTRVAGTSMACRAIIAVRLRAPELEWAAFRALQFMQFCSTGLLDEPRDLKAALATLPGIDPAEIVDAIESPEVWEAYEADRAEARTAAGSPTEAQGKTATSDGPVRYTAPSIRFLIGERCLEAGGFQPLGAYDVLLANLDPTLDRRDAPGDLTELFAELPEGLTTAEVAQILAASNDEPDFGAAEDALIELAASGRVARTGFGNGALWTLPAGRSLHAAGGGRLSRGS